MNEPAQLSIPMLEADSAAEPGRPLTAAPPNAATPEQAAAIAARDRDVLLEAGAGTGKTRVLVDRYCDSIDVDGVEPERILAFTFTEMAAGEMRTRVRAELLRRAREAADQDRRLRLARAARAGEAAPVTTIHGFCRSMLASHPVAAGLDPGFRVLDADEAARLSSAAFARALEALAATDEEVARLAAGQRRGLGSLVRSAYGELRNHGHVRAELPGLQLSALEGESEEAGGAGDLARAQAGYDALRRLLSAFAQAYEEAKAARSGADFDDLQLLALELLRRSPAIAASYRERFDHILVDEFQDTSPLQVELVRGLQGPGTRLFVVGDEFQSIYGFRGADLDGFRRRRAEALADDSAEVLRLAGSFRSTPAVVAAVNSVGAALLDGFEPLRVGRESGEHPPGPGPAAELLLTSRDGWSDDEVELPTAVAESPPNRIAEARHIALRLRELADAGAAPGSMVVLLRAFTHVEAYAEALDLVGLDPYVVGGRGYWSAQQVGDALNILACLANPLEDEALLGALASPACAAGPDALWMLRAAAGRGRHIWPELEAGLLAPPIGGEQGEPADEDEAELQRRREEWLERLPAADRERIIAFGRRLAALREEVARLPLETAVERAVSGFGLDLASLTLPGGRRRLGNLRKLARLAAEYEEHEGRDLRGFIDFAGDRAALAQREPEAAILASDHDGVKVMTVHAAKGLEFDTVVVADLGRGHLVHAGTPVALRLDFDDSDGSLAPRVGLRLARAADAPLTAQGYSELAERAAEAEAEEAARLVYVAASRARRRLLLSGLCGDSDFEPERERKLSHSTLARLLPALGVEPADERVALAAPKLRAGLEIDPPGAQEVGVRLLRGGPEAAAALAVDRRPVEPAPSAAPGGRPPMPALLERPAAASRTLSYGALAAYESCGYRFLTERVLGLGAPEGDGSRPPAGAGPPLSAAGLGRAVHALLEDSSRRGWSEPPQAAIEAAVRREGAEPCAEATGPLREMIAAWLGSDLLAEILGAGATTRAEVPFRLALGGDSVIRGSIDLLCELPGRAPLVIDYKTDATPPAPGEPLPSAYEIQRLVYTTAIATATGAGAVESAYVFLRAPERPFRATLEGPEMAAARTRIEALVERMRGGSFEVTQTPHAGLCHDCPARPRLCPYPPELTLAAA